MNNAVRLSMASYHSTRNVSITRVLCVAIERPLQVNEPQHPGEHDAGRLLVPFHHKYCHV